MKVKGLDGRIYSWVPYSNISLEKEVSSYHEKARHILKELFSCERILEEVSLPGTQPVLFADFYIPNRRLIVEVHGVQHYKWTPFFHKSKRDFFNGKKRDLKKQEWCLINDIFFVELPYSENEIEWRRRIINFGQTDS